jgi:hypothetical protein
MNIEKGDYFIVKNECSTQATIYKTDFTKDGSIILIPLYTKEARINTDTGDIELRRLSKQQKRMSILIQKIPE